MRRALTSIAMALLVLGSLVPAAAAAPAPALEQIGAEQTSSAASTESTAIDRSTTDGPPDPEEDQLGWENGYWHNESIDVNQSDGLSEAELNATVSRAIARVEVIRRMEFNETVPVDIISREEFRNRSGNRTVNETFRAFDDTKFEALLLVGENEDSLEIQEENRGSSVLGYYSPSENAIVIVSENASSPQIDEFTLAHELVHALQDQQFNLSSIRSETRDESNANSGIIEGDASLVEQRYKNRCGEGGAWNGSCVRPAVSLGQGGGGAPANLGVYFLKFQPYSDGPPFVASIYREGGWDAVNAVYNDTPESAEQVIHPEKYGEDSPTAVELTDENSGEWTRLRPPNRLDYAEVGEAGIASMFVYPLYNEGQGGSIVQPQNWLNYTDDGSVSQFDPLNYGFAYAAGWDGDRMHFYRNADGETAYVWRLVWDSPAEAEEFREGYEELIYYWGAEQVSETTYRIPEGDSAFADAFHISVEGETVTIVNAPTTAELSEIRSSVNSNSNAEETATPTETETETTTPANNAGTENTSPVTEPTGTESPGFTVLTATLALLLSALLARLR
ncbi:MAG: Hvo_1808 family surface protein [Halolamina sp.]|uniref:Hvo_1808 family surface protein n=1 Tax=Halolamina sp. TaxID=1940283 RepID=UPI002FC384BA